ncbi:uncharacterized protein CTHT_0040030 [Thermochaetoides thermophila DSM 1495]|uniref:Enoyl reductase (ER) domain-containing protein n=1 Tax=Chaetomium thermophilum (strain DSM 1495 / CBS 144.50 / IMI 039719) TaxID=759272 RepID=G0S8R1_CHATD|nr:hypothetical protein CTHT_0040030 [Thermochaetoides thermophila DSM 1495]EGS20264.1 hypothetical protein CTHT_0040030 [Thermochaetoides thermophila DSM 1495]
MKTASITAWGQPPVFNATSPGLPAPTESQIRAHVLATSIPPVVRGRALGLHPSSKGATLPYDPSLDGVVLDQNTGDTYYVTPLAAKLWAEEVNVEKQAAVKLPRGVDPVAVAAWTNPVGSSWMALKCRALPNSVQGARVLVMGVTSLSGRAAVHVAKDLGASSIIGASRKQETLDQVTGLDGRVLLTDPFVLPKEVGPIDIILDFVGGRAAIGALSTAQIEAGKELQYIHVGDLAGEEEIMLPSKLLNARPIRITGSGMGAWGKGEVKREIGGLLECVSRMERPEEVVTVGLEELPAVWDSEEVKGKRLVLTPTVKE